jgi:hypothetical protein
VNPTERDTLQRVARSAHTNLARISAECAADRAKPLTLGDLADMACGERTALGDLVGLRTAVANLLLLRAALGDSYDMLALLPHGARPAGTVRDWLDHAAALEVQLLALNGLSIHVQKRRPKPAPRDARHLRSLPAQRRA